LSPTPSTSDRLQRDPGDDAAPPTSDREAATEPDTAPDTAPDTEAGTEAGTEPGTGSTPDAERTAGTSGTAEDSSTGGERGGFARWRGRLAGALAAMLFAATATVAVLQWMAADRLALEKAEREVVSVRAGEFAVALQTYEYTDLQAYRDQVFALSGEDFEKTYSEAFSPLEGVITTMRANSSASIRGVYLSDVGEGRAKAITVVDSQVTSTAGTRRMLGTYMELNLVKTGEQWKVNAATVMGAAEELVTDPDGTPAEPSPSPSPSSSEKEK